MLNENNKNLGYVAPKKEVLQFIEVRVKYPKIGERLLKFDYTTQEQKDWTKNQIYNLTLKLGRRNILSQNLREN
jgi:hypothetical protein